MKIFRRPATATAVALGLTAALVVAAPATSADYYVVDSDLGTEDADSNRGYPDNTWFTGSSTTGTQTSTDDGIELTARTMLLYGAAEIPLTGDLFIELVQSISVDADGPWSLQLPIYYDNDTPIGFTTFRPAADNTTGSALDSQWISSSDSSWSPTLQDIADDIDSAIAEGYNPALLAFGVLVDTGWEQLTLRSFTFDGDTHYFTAEPEDEELPVEEDDEVDDAPPAAAVDAEATFTG